MDVELKKTRDGVALMFPAHLLSILGVSVGQALSLDVAADGRIILTPVRRPRYTLAGMIAECDLAAPPPSDLGLWDAARPVGREVW